MALERRIVKLEARRAVTVADTGARDRLAAMLARIEAAVLASGDTAHRDGAGPMENLVRAGLRGEVDLVPGLRGILARKQPQ